MEKGKIEFDDPDFRPNETPEERAQLFLQKHLVFGQHQDKIRRLVTEFAASETADLESDLATITAERDRLRLALDVLESQLRESRDTLAALGTNEATARIGATRASDGLSEARAILEGKE